MLITVTLATPAVAKNPKKPTALEIEIRNFFGKVTQPSAQVDLPITGRLRKKSHKAGLDFETTLDRAKASLEISATGEFHYFLSALSMRVEAKREDIDRWIPKGSQLSIVQITVTPSAVEVLARPERGPGAIRGIALSTHLTGSDSCLSVVKVLGQFINLGRPAKDLIRLEANYSSIQEGLGVARAQLASHAEATPDASLMGERGFKGLLVELIENRKSRDELLGTSSNISEIERELLAAKAWETDTLAEMARILPSLEKLTGQQFESLRTYSELVNWADKVRLAIGDLQSLQRKCSWIGCKSNKEIGVLLEGLDDRLLRFLADVRLSVERSCDLLEPLSRERLDLALESHIPDNLIERRLRACGLSFVADSGYLRTLAAQAKEFPATVALIKSGEASRLSASQLRSRLLATYKGLQSVLSAVSPRKD